MNEMQIFTNSEFGSVRTLDIDNDIYFVGKDVAEILGYANTKDAILSHVDEDDKRIIQKSENTTFEIPNRGLTLINESGLYSLILSSKLPSAKKFKRWVTSEVLPSIRKTGAYSVPTSTDDKIILLAQGHVELKAEIDSMKSEILRLKTALSQQQSANNGLTYRERNLITTAVSAKVVQTLGGKGSNAYKDRKLMRKVFRDLYTATNRSMGVYSYKTIAPTDISQYIQYVTFYEPSPSVYSEILAKNLA